MSNDHLQQVLLDRRGTDEFRPFVPHIVQGTVHRTIMHLVPARIVQDRFKKAGFIQPPIIMSRLHNQRHPVVDAAHGFVRRRGEDDAAIFLRVHIQLMFRFLLPQAGKAKRLVLRHREPDGRLVRRPLVKPIRRNQAALRQILPEHRAGNRLGLGVDERLLAPGRFEPPLHVHLFNSPGAAPYGRNDLRGGDVVTRADGDDDFNLTNDHGDLFLGEAVTGAHLRPNIMLHRGPRQAGMRFVLGVVKSIPAPAIQI